MKRIACATPLFLILALFPATASAVVIDFNASGGNGLTTYQEDGFSIVALTGDFSISDFGGGTGNVI